MKNKGVSVDAVILSIFILGMVIAFSATVLYSSIIEEKIVWSSQDIFLAKNTFSNLELSLGVTWHTSMVQAIYESALYGFELSAHPKLTNLPEAALTEAYWFDGTKFAANNYRLPEGGDRCAGTSGGICLPNNQNIENFINLIMRRIYFSIPKSNVYVFMNNRPASININDLALISAWPAYDAVSYDIRQNVSVISGPDASIQNSPIESSASVSTLLAKMVKVGWMAVSKAAMIKKENDNSQNIGFIKNSDITGYVQDEYANTVSDMNSLLNPDAWAKIDVDATARANNDLTGLILFYDAGVSVVEGSRTMYSGSASSAHSGLGCDDYVDRYNKYAGMIDSALAEYPLYDFGVNNPQALVAAVIQQESGFNSKAVSSADAIGLMQILPSAHPECGTREELFDPKTNILCGIAFMHRLAENGFKKGKSGRELIDAIAGPYFGRCEYQGITYCEDIWNKYDSWKSCVAGGVGGAEQEDVLKQVVQFVDECNGQNVGKYTCTKYGYGGGKTQICQPSGLFEDAKLPGASSFVCDSDCGNCYQESQGTSDIGLNGAMSAQDYSRMLQAANRYNQVVAITSGYEDYRNSAESCNENLGYGFDLLRGSSVPAAMSGTVVNIVSGWQGCGDAVWIRQNGDRGIIFSYGHITVDVSIGQQVVAGQKVGHISSCDHVDVKVFRDNENLCNQAACAINYFSGCGDGSPCDIQNCKYSVRWETGSVVHENYEGRYYIYDETRKEFNKKALTLRFRLRDQLAAFNCTSADERRSWTEDGDNDLLCSGGKIYGCNTKISGLGSNDVSSGGGVASYKCVSGARSFSGYKSDYQKNSFCIAGVDTVNPDPNSRDASGNYHNFCCENWQTNPRPTFHYTYRTHFCVGDGVCSSDTGEDQTSPDCQGQGSP